MSLDQIVSALLLSLQGAQVALLLNIVQRLTRLETIVQLQLGPPARAAAKLSRAGSAGGPPL